MWFRSLIDSLSRKPRRAARPKQTPRRLQVEGLEDRCLMALYAVTDLGTLGGNYTSAADLNQSGQIVGYSRTADSLVDHAFLWQSGMMIDLGTLGGNYSYAESINDLGQVVGYAALPGNEVGRAFLITPQGGVWFQDSDLDGRNDLMIDLGTLEGFGHSGATDINNASQVVGWTSSTAFLWDTASGLTDLGGGYPMDINGIGQVAVSGYDPLSGHNSAFLWQGDNGGATLGAGPGYTDSQAAAVNDAGQVVGYEWDASAQVYHAMLWTPDSPNGPTGSFTDLDTLGLGSNSTAINNSGQVVGSITVDIGGGAADSFYEPRAFLWDAAAGGPTLLQNQLLPGANVTLEYAQAINEGGAITVIGYNNFSGQRRSYLLTPIPTGTPLIRIADAPAVTEGNAGTRAANFTVTLSVASTEVISVAYATRNDSATAVSDFNLTSGIVTFTPGESSRTITVPVIGDRLAEPNQTFFLNLTNPTNATIADGQGVGTILDDEPRISIGDATKSEGKKNQTTLFTFTVTLSTPYDQPVTMSFHTVDGTAKTGDQDYVAKAGTLTFAPGQTTKTITIEVKGDSKKEASETFYLDLFGNSSNSLLTKNRGIGTILNDD